jgi:hypothetical protein
MLWESVERHPRHGLCDTRPEALFVECPRHVFRELSGSFRMQCQAGKKDVDGALIFPPDAKPDIRYFVVRDGQMYRVL